MARHERALQHEAEKQEWLNNLKSAQQSDGVSQNTSQTIPAQAPESLGSQDQSASSLAQFEIPKVDLTPPPPVDNSRELEELQRERARASELEERLKAETELRRQAEESSAEFRRKQREQELRDAVKFDDIEFNSADSEDFKRAFDKVLPVIEEKLSLQKEEAYNRLINEASTLRNELESIKRGSEQQRAQSINERILSAVPNFVEIQKTQQYANFISQPVTPGSKLTVSDLLWNEYNNGNADFVINTIKQMIADKPDVTQVASVQPVTTGTSPAAPSTEQTGELSVEERRQLRHSYLTGAITKEEWLKKSGQIPA